MLTLLLPSWRAGRAIPAHAIGTPVKEVGPTWRPSSSAVTHRACFHLNFVCPSSSFCSVTKATYHPHTLFSSSSVHHSLATVTTILPTTLSTSWAAPLGLRTAIHSAHFSWHRIAPHFSDQLMPNKHFDTHSSSSNQAPQPWAFSRRCHPARARLLFAAAPSLPPSWRTWS